MFILRKVELIEVPIKNLTIFDFLNISLLEKVIKPMLRRKQKETYLVKRCSFLTFISFQLF